MTAISQFCRACYFDRDRLIAHTCELADEPQAGGTVMPEGASAVDCAVALVMARVLIAAIRAKKKVT